MESYETPQRAAARKAADELHALVHLDTVFGDLYLRRARELLAPHLGEADFRALSRAQTEADLLPDRIRAAMGIQDWKVVQELSARLAMLKRRLQETAEIRGVAQKVYDLDDVLVDPFSPGLRALAGVTASALPGLRDAGLRRLDQLRALDPAWEELYASRERALRSVAVDTGEDAPAAQGGTPSQLHEQALQALARGDLKTVQEISAKLQKGGAAAAPSASSGEGDRHDGRNHDLTHVFPDEAIQEAGRLGLAPVHMESIRLDVDELFRNAWRPRTGGAEADSGGAVRLSVTLPADLPEALRDHLEMYLDRPFVNSGGARYLPQLGDEDLLVEDFDDPPPGAPAGEPPHARGPRPRPPLRPEPGPDRARPPGERQPDGGGDRARPTAPSASSASPRTPTSASASARGWGKQPQWTHMDGFMLQNRKWLALAGGDTRFGGVFDLVGLGRENDIENLTARFAVVQRRRLSAWPVSR